MNETQPTMSLSEITINIYHCLMMLTMAGQEDLHDWWCELLYEEDGAIRYSMWTEYCLQLLEEDVAYHT